MIKLGKDNTLKVAREVDFGVYLTDGQEEILLPNKYIPEGTKVDDEIEVFVYKDSEDRPIATTLEPYAKLDEYACLECVDTNASGAFLDWGLEKDLFVPLKEQQSKMNVGGKYVVRVCFDHKTDRLVGVGKINSFFEPDTNNLREGQEVDVLVYGKSELGFKCIVDNLYTGLIYSNDVFTPLSVGDRSRGFVKTIREDGKVDVSIRPVGMDAITEAKHSILVNLRFAKDGKLDLHDKSESEEIKLKLGMSKKLFKKAIGGLYKDGKIELMSDGIKIKKPD